MIQALAIFLGAVLLFLVQPLAGKFVLPWYGGSAGVWTTCLLFFQTALLAGYAWAHGLRRFLHPRAQAVAHVALLAAACAVLPVVPSDRWKPATPENPEAGILLLLAATVGLPCAALAATSPLLQAWFADARPRANPYRLYALSNVGSLLALLAYPFAVEPALPRLTQARAWSWGFATLAALVGVCAYLRWRREAGAAAAAAGAAEPAAAGDPSPSRGRRAMWVALPAASTALLLAVTQQITTDVAAVPLLWVVPLTFYLATFVVCFDHPRWYRRGLWLPALVVGTAAGCAVLLAGEYLPIRSQVAGLCLLLVSACMVCHGELFRLRPEPRRLTGYYLAVAAGGALGGLAVAVVGPLVLDVFLDLHVAVLACLGLAAAAIRLDEASVLRGRWRNWAGGAAALVILAAGAALAVHAAERSASRIESTRNFYGVLHVEEYQGEDPEFRQRALRHGRILHGSQFVAPDRRREPTTYFTRSSGVGRLLAVKTRPLRRVGVIGLGAGTLAAYGRPGDTFRFYELNPEVVRLARSAFTYLADSEAKVEVELGDARLSLEREEPQRFDVLAIDAFSGDSIPTHLLTREAFETYLRHLDAEGVIAVHISNIHLDLAGVLLRNAEALHLWYLFLVDTEDEDSAGCGTDWFLLARRRELLDESHLREAWREVDRAAYEDVRAWTDDYTSLFAVLR